MKLKERLMSHVETTGGEKVSKYQVVYPSATCGAWKIDRFDVSEQDANLHNLRCAIHRDGGHILPGTYTRLSHDNTVVMSDTLSEVRDHLAFINAAEGDVLVAGLGLGIVVSALLNKKDVWSVTVIEKSPEVISLVGKHFARRKKLTIIQADIFEWKPPPKAFWSYAWFDIWDEMCTDNLKEMTRLNRKFARKAKVKDSWRRDFLLAKRRTGR